MIVLHTADLHLRRDEGERWQALQSLLELCVNESVELFVISGDLVDRGIELHDLKPHLRALLADFPIATVIIPGNHDVGALRAGDYLGPRVTVLVEAGAFVDVDDVRVVGLPFEAIGGEALLHRLREVAAQRRADACNILLYHGELLDVSYQRDDFGDEQGANYMPTRLNYFDDLGFDYVLAGHFHTTFDVEKYAGGYFVYPGSPVSVTRKEVSARCVNLFDTGGAPAARTVDTLCYERVNITLSAFDTADPVAVIRERVEATPRNARVLLDVRGLVDLESTQMSEADFARQINTLDPARVVHVAHNWRDVGIVLHNDLFRRCATRLEQAGNDREQAERIRRLLVDAVVEANNAR